MKTTRMIRNLEVGTAPTKIIVPIVAATTEGILAKGHELKSYTMDLIEWRVDFYDSALDIPTVVETARQLNEILGDTPILFTFRTKKEGGEKEIAPETYLALNKALLESGYVDAVDVEIFSGDELVKELVAVAHANGKVIVGSNHDFGGTPSKDDLLYRLRYMQNLDADIPKIAVMPKSVDDVITLLDATQTMANKYADRPIVTMSMSPMGVITRLSGEAFGSAMTFGCVGQTSAPGQIPVEKLQAATQILHDGM